MPAVGFRRRRRSAETPSVVGPGTYRGFTGNEHTSPHDPRTDKRPPDCASRGDGEEPAGGTQPQTSRSTFDDEEAKSSGPPAGSTPGRGDGAGSRRVLPSGIH